jgi:hypothetical protein
MYILMFLRDLSHVSLLTYLSKIKKLLIEKLNGTATSLSLSEGAIRNMLHLAL